MSKQKGFKNSEIALGIVLSIVMILFSRLGVFDSISSIISSPLEGFYQYNKNVFKSINEDIEFISNLALLKEEIDLLRDNNEFYKIENTDLKREIEEMRKILEQRTFENDFETIPSKILMYRNNGLDVVINKGSRDGVEINQAVITKNVFIGRVSKTYPTNSVVELVISPSIDVPVYIGGGELKGFVSGDGTGRVIIKNIPLLGELIEDEVVYTSGSDLKTPNGLLVGSLKNIISKETDLTRSANIQLFINMNYLDEVYVIIK